MYKRILLFGLLLAVFFVSPERADAQIKLMQPVGAMTEITETGLDAFFEYFDGIWPWVLSIGGGMAVLNGVIGGTMIMFAGDDGGLRSNGINKLKYSIVGLIIIAFAGMILRILNPVFYK